MKYCINNILKLSKLVLPFYLLDIPTNDSLIFWHMKYETWYICQ